MVICKASANVVCARTHATFALSGGGDSVGAFLCLLSLVKFVNVVVINHNQRYESVNDLRTMLVLIINLNVVCTNMCLRKLRLSLLSKLTLLSGHSRSHTAHTLTDNIENVLGRGVSGSAYSLCMPYSRNVFGIELNKPWIAVSPRAHAHARYVNDLLNTDASASRALWRQLNEKVNIRARVSALARARLISILY
ncbi:MAG: ATP-binding protein [Candidatus Hodgkinia cicadicola]